MVCAPGDYLWIGCHYIRGTGPHVTPPCEMHLEILNCVMDQHIGMVWGVQVHDHTAIALWVMSS